MLGEQSHFSALKSQATQTNGAYKINYMRSEPKMQNQYPVHILTSQAEICVLTVAH